MSMTIHMGRQCGSWEDTVARNRAKVDEIAPSLRGFALDLIENAEVIQAERWTELAPSPDEVDRACRELDCTLPETLEEMAMSDASNDEGCNEYFRILVAELLDLRDRVAVLEAAAL